MGWLARLGNRLSRRQSITEHPISRDEGDSRRAGKKEWWSRYAGLRFGECSGKKNIEAVRARSRFGERENAVET
jgi:hypothetical protein